MSALARAVELHDPAAARRASWRAAVVHHWLTDVAASPDLLADSLAGALLADLSHLVAPGPSWATNDVSGAVLGASLLGRLPRTQRCATVARHVHERWDGKGGPHALSGSAIPEASRVVAIANMLVGKLVTRDSPNWPKRRRQLLDGAGSLFDPQLVDQALASLDRAPIDTHDVSVSAALGHLADLSEGDRSPLSHGALATVGATLAAAMDPDHLIDLIADQTRSALGAARVSVGRIESDDRLRVVINTGDLGRGERRRPEDEVYPLSALPAFTAFVTRTSHLAQASSEDDSTRNYLALRQLASEIATTTKVGPTTWIMWATTRADGREFTEQDLATLTIAAGQLGHGLDQAGRVEQYERFAFRDALTGLSNRRVLDTQLREIFARAPVDRIDCAVIMCDVDELKVVNDTEGHEAGDAILKAAAQALVEAVDGLARATVCRIGGDEFCVILDGGGLLRAEPIADHAKAIFRRSGTNRSMSCGVAVATPNVALPGDLLRAADVAQYEQKRKRKAEMGIELPEYPERASGRRRVRRDLPNPAEPAG